MQADPQPEVVGVDLELLLGADDVGRDERQPPRRRAARGVRRQEQLVLAEHAAGHVRQDRADLHAGHPRPHGLDDRAAGAAAEQAGATPRLELLHQRLEDHAEAVDVRLDPAGTVDDLGRGRVEPAVHPGELTDVALCHAGKLAQFGDDLARLAWAHLRPWADKPGPRLNGDIPVDHGCWHYNPLRPGTPPNGTSPIAWGACLTCSNARRLPMNSRDVMISGSHSRPGCRRACPGRPGPRRATSPCWP